MKLCIENTTLTPFIALAPPIGEPVIHRFADVFQLTQHLYSALDELLHKLNAVKTQIEHIIVAVGPGSFTGIRASLAAALGLGLGLNIPVQGVTTFNLMAYSQNLPNALTTVSTKRDSYYVAQRKGVEPAIWSPTELETYGGDIVGEYKNESTSWITPDGFLKCLKANRLCDPLPLYVREPDVG